MPKPIAICPKDLTQMIDHVVPLAHLLECPILCLDAPTAFLIESEYPKTSIFLEPDFPEKVLDEYDTLVYTSLYRHVLDTFQFDHWTYRGKKRSICSLHGYSDKKGDQFWLERLADEDITLHYSNAFIDLLKEKEVYPRLKYPILMGNLRFAFYQQHQAFFDSRLPAWLKPDKKNILYAPTWNALYPEEQDMSETSSFFYVAEPLFSSVPTDVRLIVKLHPLLYRFFPEEIAQIKERFRQQENLFFLDDFPLIYPLLNACDCYLGDHSSMGYDFLPFDKPLFFFNHNDRTLPLHHAGNTIGLDEVTDTYKIIEKTVDAKKSERQKLYAQAYGDVVPFSLLKQHIMGALL